MRILVVEDDVRLRGMLRDFLREEGFAVDEAADGGEALHKALGCDYSALVLDVMMPPPDGFEVLRLLRAKGRTMPVLMLTGRGALPDRLQGLDSGADDYLLKPFELSELAARLRAAIRRSAVAPHPVLTVGPISLDTVACTVALDGRPVVLTAREFALLELLARNRGGVVTRAEMDAQIFDERGDSMSNMLDVYIYKLRQKFGKERILTRRGMGYQLVA
ncbi:MAG: response regulator transcription factor [Verrucomicrobiota bacterium]